jgi:hypothetical protein
LSWRSQLPWRNWYRQCRKYLLQQPTSDLICTSSPRTSAGLYYFSAKLAPPKYSALASWITGWKSLYNFLMPSHEFVLRMVQYHGPDYSRVFHRLHMVCQCKKCTSCDLFCVVHK